MSESLVYSGMSTSSFYFEVVALQLCFFLCFFVLVFPSFHGGGCGRLHILYRLGRRGLLSVKKNIILWLSLQGCCCTSTTTLAIVRWWSRQHKGSRRNPPANHFRNEILLRKTWACVRRVALFSAVLWFTARTVTTFKDNEMPLQACRGRSRGGGALLGA